MKEKMFKKGNKRRLLGMALALVMMLTLIPSSGEYVYAESIGWYFQLTTARWGPSWHSSASTAQMYILREGKGGDTITVQNNSGDPLTYNLAGGDEAWNTTGTLSAGGDSFAVIIPQGYVVDVLELYSPGVVGHDAFYCVIKRGHEHGSFDSDWTSDAIGHWHACGAEGCDVTESDVNSHTADGFCYEVHDWSYDAQNNQIEAACQTCERSATITLTSSAMDYSGSAIPVTVTAQTDFPVAKTESDVVYYESDGTTLVAADKTEVGVAGKAPKSAGSYVAKLTIDDANGVGQDVTATLSYSIGKVEPSVTTAPTANTLTYNGTAQNLVSAGSTGHGTLQYALASDGTFSATIPTGTNAGSYSVYYKVAGDNNHSDKVFDTPVSVTISKATYAGTKTASGNILVGYASNDIEVTLPAIPDHMEYGTPTYGAPITSATIAGGKLKYSANNTATETTYTITVPVSEKSGENANYSNYNITVTLTGIVCDHSSTTPVTEVPATCTVDGVEAHDLCSVCGVKLVSGVVKTDEELKIEMLGHNWTAKNGICGVCHFACTHSEQTTGICETCGKDLDYVPPVPDPEPAPEPVPTPTVVPKAETDMATVNIAGATFNTWEEIVASTPKLTVESLHKVNDSNDDLLHVNIVAKADKTIPAVAVKVANESSIGGLHVFIGESDAITFLSGKDYTNYTGISFKHEDVVTDNSRIIDFTSKGAINATVLFHTLIAPNVRAKVYKVVDGKEVEIATSSSNEDGGFCFEITELAKYIIRY